LWWIGPGEVCQTPVVSFDYQFYRIPWRFAMVAEIEFDDDLFDPDDDNYIYNQQHGAWELRPEWLHPECVSTILALARGTCCKYPADALVSQALDLADAVERTLTGFDDGNSDCAQTACELVRLMGSVPALVAAIRLALPAADRTTAAQLLCPVGRLILLALELANRAGCPMACTVHGEPDRRPGVAPFVSLLEECDETLWAAVIPQRPRRRRGV
jgi:hypothetical protein